MNKIKTFMDKHSKFRKIVDIVDDKINMFGIISWLIIGAFISAFVIYLYYCLPNEIQKPISVIIGTVFTTLAIPLMFNNLNKRYETKKCQFERCNDYYNQITKMIIDVLQHSSDNERNKRINELSKYFNDNYYFFCINFSSELLLNINDLKKECDYKKDSNAVFSLDNFIHFSEKCLKSIRRQGNINGKVYFNNAFIKK